MIFIANSIEAASQNANKNRETFGPLLYPDLMKSYEFKKRLLSVKVKPTSIGKELSYYDYLLNYQKKPWWSLFLSKAKIIDAKPINIFKPSQDEYTILELLNGRVYSKVDTKTMVITVKVTDQDPEICAIIADSAKVLLERSIIEYHSNKASENFEFNKKILSQRKESYKQASKKYSSFVDSNRDVVTAKVKSKIEQLEKDMILEYQSYLEAASQAIESEALVQEAKPAFATLQSATVPLSPDIPDRVRIVIMSLTYIFYIITAYILYKEKFWRRNITLKIHK